jgi:hypothetical protein
MEYLQEYINRLKTIINEGNTRGEDTSSLQKLALDTRDALDLFARGIENVRQKAIESGERLAQAFDAGVKDVLTTALTGGDWKKALKGFLDSFTKQVVSSFVDGLMDPITGENGILSNLFRKIGQSIYGGGNSLGSSAAGGLDKLFGGNLSKVAPYQTSGVKGNPLGSALPVMKQMVGQDGFASVITGGEAVQTGATTMVENMPRVFDDFEKSFGNLLKLPSAASLNQGGGGLFGALGSGGAPGSGMMGMSQYGIAGLAGSIFGTLLGLFIAKKKGYKDGGLIGKIPGFKKGGFLGGALNFGVLGILGSLIFGKKKDRKKNLFRGLFGLLGGGILGSMGGGGIMGIMGGKASGGKISGPGSGTSFERRICR